MLKILVVRFSSLGDVILTTPVVHNLKNQLPDSKIFFAVKKKYAGVLEQDPNIDQIIALDENESFFSFIKRVRKEDIDILIDLHQTLRSWLLSRLSGIPRVVRYKKAFFSRRLYVSRRVKSLELNRHTVHRYLDVLECLGLESKMIEPKIFTQKTTSNIKIPYLKILVVQTAFLGDAVLTTPLLKILKQKFPLAKITLLCTPEIKELFTDNSSLDQLLVMDKRGKDRSLLSVFRWAKKLKGEFDIAILPHRSFKSALITALARIPKRIGFKNSQGNFFLTDLVPFDWSTHDSERNLKLLEVLGITSKQTDLEVPLKNDSIYFKQFLEEHQIKEGTILVGINPGSVWKTKRWLPEYFAQVADHLTEEWKCRVLIFGSKQNAESANSVVSQMKLPALNLCGKTDLKNLIFLISRCSLFITNDSGPMHLASATHVPLVAIFGPTTRELGFFPLGEKSVVVELNLPCRPCSLHGGEKCPLGHFKCMRDLTPETVLKECRKLLHENIAPD